MYHLKNKIKSVRFKLFATMCIVITIIVLCLIAANNIVFETFYIHSKTNKVKQVYQKINNHYKYSDDTDIEKELKRIAFNNNCDIFIKSDEGVFIFSTDKDFYSTLNGLSIIIGSSKSSDNVIYKDGDIIIRKINDTKNNNNYILLEGTLCNGYNLYIRIPVVPIEESVKISNEVLLVIGGITILISAFISSFVSKKFTDPILQLNDIANKMSKLDFSKKYRISDTENEINELGISINTMSDKLERTIKQLRDNNIELEKDIEEKSKIDEMRKQFISDVSHELKTPIALIQGYAEGLIENVNTDEESRKFYAEVILDESNKMDQLVKKLLELMKIEYVYADEFYIEQVITNYFTNAMKHCESIDGRKEIEIKIYPNNKNSNIRFCMFNTGTNIKEEDLERIWGRFYKVDASRNRDDGGSGIGLALVKAIMNNYQSDYGVVNKDDGVEFYFELSQIDHTDEKNEK